MFSLCCTTNGLVEVNDGIRMGIVSNKGYTQVILVLKEQSQVI